MSSITAALATLCAFVATQADTMRFFFAQKEHMQVSKFIFSYLVSNEILDCLDFFNI